MVTFIFFLQHLQALLLPGILKIDGTDEPFVGLLIGEGIICRGGRLGNECSIAQKPLLSVGNIKQAFDESFRLIGMLAGLLLPGELPVIPYLFFRWVIKLNAIPSRAVANVADGKLIALFQGQAVGQDYIRHGRKRLPPAVGLPIHNKAVPNGGLVLMLVDAFHFALCHFTMLKNEFCPRGRVPLILFLAAANNGDYRDCQGQQGYKNQRLFPVFFFDQAAGLIAGGIGFFIHLEAVEVLPVFALYVDMEKLIVQKKRVGPGVKDFKINKDHLLIAIDHQVPFPHAVEEPNCIPLTGIADVCPGELVWWHRSKDTKLPGKMLWHRVV